MSTKTYNVDAWGIPATLVEALHRIGPLPLRYTRHALTEALNYKYGTLASRHFPTLLNVADWDLVEVTAVGEHPVKFVVRRPVDDTRSLVLVIGLDGTVRTLWTNLIKDIHSTLDKSKFSKP